MKMPARLENMMFGFIESQVLFVCDELKLFDYLAEQGAASCQVISQALGLPSASLERLLIGATSMKLLEKQADQYSVAAEWLPYLTRNSEHYCGGKFTHYWKSSYKIFEFLKPAVQEDRPQWSKLDATTASEEALDFVYSNAIYTDAQSTQEFLATMWASGYQDSHELCKKYSFAGYHKLIDLGGATGSFAIAALENNPQLHAGIMDYPQVKPYAEAKFHAHQVQTRASFYTGNMFNDPLPEGDIYAIGYVLSDWPESHCLALIQKVYDSLPQNGLIVILEKFFNEDKTGPYLTAMLNLIMLLEMHGTHRSANEYLSWLSHTGFTDCQVVYSSGEKHMLIGRKS